MSEIVSMMYLSDMKRGSQTHYSRYLSETLENTGDALESKQTD